MPLIQATSVPGLWRAQIVAISAQLDLARVEHDELRASRHRLADLESDDRVGLGGVRSGDEDDVGLREVVDGVGHRSGAERRARPATVEEWHRRAQWSTLLVPITARMNFWNT